jgi:hypothetical protein
MLSKQERDHVISVRRMLQSAKAEPRRAHTLSSLSERLSVLEDAVSALLHMAMDDPGDFTAEQREALLASDTQEARRYRRLHHMNAHHYDGPEEPHVPENLPSPPERAEQRKALKAQKDAKRRLAKEKRDRSRQETLEAVRREAHGSDEGSG